MNAKFASIRKDVISSIKNIESLVQSNKSAASDDKKKANKPNPALSRQNSVADQVAEEEDSFG